jgi:hypothetical protein
MNTYFTTELIRPWKLAALAWGISALWYGMYVEPAPDWTPATILWMAAGTHLLAPWSVDTFMRLRWRHMPLALLAGWLVVDGLWMVAIDGSAAAWSMRAAQWQASACLFALYGLFLRPKASLLDGLRSISAALHLRPKV